MEAMLETAKSIGFNIAEAVLIIYFCIRYLKSMVGKADISKGVKEQNTIDLDMVNEMERVKEILHADRVLLFEFHNGQHYSSHRNALKMSVTYEVFRAGLTPCRNLCSGIPISVMPKFVYNITTEKELICRDIEDIKADMSGTYNFKNALGIKSFYDAAIHNADGEVIGFVAIQWNKVMPEEVDVKVIEKLTWYLEEKLKKITEKDKLNIKK